MIKTEVFNRSKEVAQEIVDKSLHLRAVGAQADYLQRDPYFQELLGESGHLSFNPTVQANILDPFKEMLDKGVSTLRDNYYSSCGEESRKCRALYYLATQLKDSIVTENMLENTVPSDVSSMVDRHSEPNDRYIDPEEKKIYMDFKSPKLSKILVKLWGEQHDIVKWFTSKCPKKLETGVLSDWTVNVSILPHHITGMSYYAALNHGGKRWREGYEGTSCMDTKRNGTGQGIYQLIPSIKDETMAVAYLSHATDDDIWNPIYQARVLLRVFYLNGEPHLIACRSYYTDNETNHIIIDGLRNEFKNVHDVRVIRSYNDYNGDDYKVTRTYAESITLEIPEDVKCPTCGGVGNAGTDEDGDTIYCEDCDGEGNIEAQGSHLPYIDDDEFIQVYDDRAVFEIPMKYLKYKGIKVTPTDLPEGWTAEYAEEVEPETVEVELVETVGEATPARIEVNEHVLRIGEDIHIAREMDTPVNLFGDLELDIENMFFNGNRIREILGLTTPRQGYYRRIEQDEEITEVPELF